MEISSFEADVLESENTGWKKGKQISIQHV